MSTDVDRRVSLLASLVRIPSSRNVIDNIRAGRVNPIRGWRVLRGMDQKTLVNLTGIRQPNLARLEKPDAPTPTVSTLRKIASALGVSIEDLIRGR